MSIDDLPVIEQVIESGANDRVFDALLLSGPLVILLIALIGRTLLTRAMAAAYLAVFVGYVLYKGVRSSGSSA
ncbi:MAG: hypothetical protein ABEJ85_02855 [Haloarculaceae archaeon]